MYTTTTADRQKGLVASSATHRAMRRHVCSKSQFKFMCFSCGEMINRGDKITRCNRATTGMKLRFRGADSQNGLTMGETAFYQGETGKDMWVHIGCNPCYWDEGLDTGHGSTYPALRTIRTEWSWKVENEFEEWCDSTEDDRDEIPHFYLMKGYPEEKFMKDRIIHAVTRFQALWRGFIYKIAYPEALLQAQAEQMYPPEMQKAVDEAIAEALSYRQQTCWEEEQQSSAQAEALSYRQQTCTSGVRLRKRTATQAEAMFYCHNKSRVGSNTAILFDLGKKNEAIYSCEIMRISGEANGVHVYVRFHHDDESRKYHWRRFQRLELECHNFMMKMGIKLVAFEGKISTHHRHRFTM